MRERLDTAMAAYIAPVLGKEELTGETLKITRILAAEQTLKFLLLWFATGIVWCDTIQYIVIYEL